jgi:hypothetical protein
MEISPLAKRVAARHLKALEETGREIGGRETSGIVPEGGGGHSGGSGTYAHEGGPEHDESEQGQEQTAIPKSGPGKSVMMKQLIQMKEALERTDHDAFKKGLEGLNSLFEKSTHVKEG